MYLQTMSDIILGSSIIFSAQGGWGKEKNLVAAKNSVRPSEGAAEGGCGGNSAAPERNQTEASPAALLVQSRAPQKSFLFLLEEKIGARKSGKAKKTFLWGGERQLAAAGRLP